MGVAPDAIEYLWDRLHELEPTSKLGGICAFKPGYHASRKENKANWPNDYSIQDSEDQGGDDDWCAAIDWTFPDAQAGNYATINKYSNRLMASGKDMNDDRLNNLREFFGNTDQDVKTEGWDYRYAVSSTSSDNTHAWHIHISFDRKWANDRPTMDRLIIVLQGDDVALSADQTRDAVWNRDNAVNNDGFYWRTDSPKHDPPGNNPEIMGETAITEAAQRGQKAYETALEVKEQTTTIDADMQFVQSKLDQILAILQAGVPVPGQVNLTPEAVAAVADATADEIHADPERDGV